MKHLNYIILAAVCMAFAPLQMQAQTPAEAKKAAEAKRKAEAEARKKAAEELKKRQKEITDFVNGLDKKRLPYAEQIEALKELAKKPEYAQDALQHRIYNEIIRSCRTPAWTRIAQYDYHTKDTELLPAVEKIQTLNIGAWQKMGALQALSVHYCDLEQFAEAEKTVQRIFALPGMNKNQLADAHCAMATVYRLQDRYDDAMKEIHKAAEYHAGTALKSGTAIAMMFDRIDDAEKLLEKYGDQYTKLDWFSKKRHLKDCLPEAIVFIKNPENKFEQRFSLARGYLAASYGAAEMSEARKSLAAEIKAGKTKGNWSWLIQNPLKMKDYRLAAEWCGIFDGTPVMEAVQNRKSYVTALGALGQQIKAAQLAEEYSKAEKLSAKDKVTFQCYAAVLSGKDDVSGILKAANLPRKEEAAIILDLAKNCISAWNMQEAAEKYEAEYNKYFAKQEQRSIAVKYFDTPVSNITAWRQIYPQLEKQYCDILYRGSMEFLETDVATGDRNVKIDKDAKPVKTLELTTLCDRYGVHIFLRAEADNARDIENGFASGISTEMYFSPGRNQPYSCLGSDAKSGVTFIFDTTYNNKNAKRLDKNSPVKSFRSEVEFTDTDYVLHMFFAWDGFYNKLPANPGDAWRFECLAWTPAGGFSWGGSQGIHSASAWGDLKFDLTAKQLTTIRKGIIFSTYKGYKLVPRDPGVRENLFDMWADDQIGDPEFYAKYLAPLQEELDGYAKMVHADMSDADVAKVYANALPRWKGLAHEVDELRRKYLTERLIRTGK